MVYRVDVTMDPRDTGELEWRLWIDPRSGQVTRRANVTKRTEGVGHSYYYGTVPQRTFYYPPSPDYWYEGFTLEDHLRPAPGQYISTSSWYCADLSGGPPEAFFDPGDVWGNSLALDQAHMADPGHGPMSEYGQTAAADALRAVGWAWDLYANVFGRNGPFGNGDKFDNVVNCPGLNAPTFANRTRTMYINIGDAQCEPQADLVTIGHEVGQVGQVDAVGKGMRGSGGLAEPGDCSGGRQADGDLDRLARGPAELVDAGDAQRVLAGGLA